MSDTVSSVNAEIVPLAEVPSQIVNATLGGQSCNIHVYQKTTGLFLDLYVQNVLIIGGVVCLNAVKIVRDLYLGFIGDLAFFDIVGSDDPTSAGLGTRFILAYLPP